MKRTLQLIKSGGALLTLLLISLVLPSSAWADEVTFNPSTNKGSLSAYKANTSDKVTVSPITIQATVGAFAIGTDYRCYTGSMTINTSEGNITSIVITCTTGSTKNDKKASNFSTKSGTYSASSDGITGTWTGSASSVTLTASGQVRMTKIVVTYTSGTSKTATTLTLDKSECTLTLGTTTTATLTPKLKAGETDITDATIKYESSKPSVATVDKNGMIRAVAAGTTTITATYEENDTYIGSTATCDVTVIDPNAPTYIYKKVTSADEITTSDSYIVVCEESNTAMGAIPSNGKYATNVSVTLKSSTYSGEVNTSGMPYEITLEESGTDGYYNVKTTEGYLYANSANGADLKVSSTADNSSNDKYLWSIDVTSKYSPLCSKYNSRYLAYNGSNKDRFAVYDSSFKGLGVSYLYKKVESGSFTISEEQYATYYTEDAYVMPEGVQGGVITAIGDANTDGKRALNIDYRYAAGKTVPAKTALLLKGAEGTYTYTKTTRIEEAPTDNLLHGANAVDAETGKTSVAGATYYYILSHSEDGKKFGFYWAEDNGAATTYQSPYAFLAVTSTSAIKGFSLEDATTGIALAPVVAPANAAIYTLSGVRVNAASTDDLPAGLYIVGGKKVIVK